MIEIVNECVLIPDRPNWTSPIKWSRRWPSTVAEAGTGAEDRAFVANGPKQRIEFTSLTPTVNERNRLISRALKALRNGNAAVGNWGRPAYAGAEFSTTTVAVDTEPPLVAGDWILITHPRAPLINRVLQINCGGGDVSPFTSDAFQSPVGNVVGVGNAIDRSLVTDPAPEAVYQFAREVITVNVPSELTYTLAGFTPNVSCLVRLHFAELDPNMAGTYERKMDITVSGSDSTAWALYSPYTAAGNALYKATVLEAFVTPTTAGVITVKISGVYPHIEGIPSVFYYPAAINAIEVHQITYAARQLSAVVAGQWTWSERLRSKFPKDSLLMPLMFGRFGIGGSVTSLTDFAAQAPSLIVEEPKGSGTVAVTGACPVPPNLSYPYDSDPGIGVLPGNRQVTKYRWRLNSTPNPNEALLYEQVAWHKITAQNEQPTAIGFYWEYVPGPQSTNQFNAETKWLSGSTDPFSSTGDSAVPMSSGYWTLVAVTP